MKTIIHVNQAIIRSNTTHGKTDPPITVKTYKSNQYVRNVIIVDDSGNVIGRVVYQPETPLSCGAKVWIECDSKNVNVIVRTWWWNDIHY